MSDPRRPIRIAHLADTHLGYRAYADKRLPGDTDDPTDQGENMRQRDVRLAFEDAMLAIRVEHSVERIDLLVHAGDVFNGPTPRAVDLIAVVRAMRELARLGIPQLWIAGNHDMPGGLARHKSGAFGILQAAVPEAIIIAEPSTCTRALAIAGEGGEPLYIQVDAYPHGAARYMQQYQDVPERDEHTHLLLAIAHGEVDALGALHQGSDVAQLVARYDYIALGHIHQNGTYHTEAGTAIMPGPTERYGWRDQHATPGWILATLTPEESSSDWIETISHRPVRARAMIDIGEIAYEAGDTTITYENELARRMCERDDLTLAEIRESIARIHISGLPRDLMREVPRDLAAAYAGMFWHLQVDTTEAASSWSAPATSSRTEAISIEAMFSDFILERAGELGSEFADLLKARGVEAIASARALETEEGER